MRTPLPTAALAALVLLTACVTGGQAPPATVVVPIPDGEYRWHDGLGYYLWCADETAESCRVPPLSAELLREDTCW